ncbi:hypothetical protein FGO68_gene17393 [Halteria grandinella]|uniref:MORN repeat protein n=1 Tax=Halteria grandinella TaxID=5974 RepID=A0A8J8P426_HALGN|nr:hypothetical protein FGO68_gene17393 [Halteria grandinella]
MQVLSSLCESHSHTVRRVEKKIGFQSILAALREIIEIQSIKNIPSKKRNIHRGASLDFETNEAAGMIKPNQALDFMTNIKVQSNTIYTGQFDPTTSTKQGFGIQIWPDGSKYVGLWLQGKASGFGRFILADGDAYEGSWLDGKAHGTGIYFYADGAHYQGEYRDGKKHGKGCFTWSDGATYSGEWQANKMHGYGVFRLPDGRKYEGEYSNDRKHGKGVFTYADGRRKDGVWQNGKQIRSNIGTKRDLGNVSNILETTMNRSQRQFHQSLVSGGPESTFTDSSRYLPL